MVNFYDFLNNTFLRFLKDFCKLSEAHAKTVECILSYLNMVAQTQKKSIIPFCEKKVSRLLHTAGFNVNVLKINLTELCTFFYNFQMSTVTCTASGNE